MATEARKAFDSLAQGNEMRALARPDSFEASRVEITGYEVAARLIDIFGSIALLIALLPLFVVSCLVVLIMTGRPVFIAQRRIGLDGKPFKMLKIRTMVPNAHEMKAQVLHLNFMSGPFFKAKNDPRITPPGRYLRQLSLDELPQLLNVLKGEMSLVGPRPMLPEEVASLQCHDILQVKPGLTGLWQVSGRNTVTDFRDKLALDRKYIESQSILLDIKILFKTVTAVFKSKGAF